MIQISEEMMAREISELRFVEGLIVGVRVMTSQDTVQYAAMNDVLTCIKDLISIRVAYMPTYFPKTKPQ